MAFFKVTNRQATTVAVGSLLVLKTAATKRAKIIGLFAGGSDGTPADVNVELQLQRASASFGTPVAGAAPTALDPAEPAALTTRDDSGATEPTYTADVEVLRVGMNGRGTIRWVPEVPGLAIIVPISGFLGMSAQYAIMTLSWDLTFEE